MSVAPPVVAPPAPPPRPACPEGQVQNTDTEGHCCWPGQYWVPSQRSCGGTPTCPTGMESVSGGCYAACTAHEVRQGTECACREGRVRSADTRNHCCWPGQAWIPSRAACAGSPVGCPSGYESMGESCVRQVRCPDGMLAVRGSSREGLDYGFCMDRTEVTVAAYRACVNAGACAPPENDEYRNNWVQSGRDQHPVNYVDAAQADAFCAWRGGRLPTEAEWQFAAQGPDGRTYPWGEDAPSSQLCWNRQDGTCSVGSFPAGQSPFGLDDMAGNVWEWTSSSENSNRVLRGGGWVSNDAARVRAADRIGLAPSVRRNFLGFRCARGAL